MSKLLDEFMSKLHQARSFPPVASAPLVSRAADLEWLGPELTGNPSKLALYLQSPAKTFELFLQEMPPGTSSDMQRHHHESIHFVIEGDGYSIIEGERVQWSSNDCVYTPPWAWHRHYNDSERTVRMLGIENSRLLDAVGPVNRRESVGMKSWDELQEMIRSGEVIQGQA
jgi:mannose-6-phosphate isomerase-like protein (cupin superfamily)